jgi:hypothetical protein
MQCDAFKAANHMMNAAQKYIGGEGAIKSHLFILAINNSGSTFLARALGGAPGAWSLPREGQHVPGFAGPSSRGTGTGLLWAATPENEALFTDPAAYDWARTRRAWHFQAGASQPDASVLILSSPPFLLIAEELARIFPDAFFLMLVRHPLPVIEGILRGTVGTDVEAQEALVEQAVAHVIRGMQVQLRNCALLHGRVVKISYEVMCAMPAKVGQQIEALAPALGPVTLDQHIAVKGHYDERLRDMNADQVARLSPALRLAIEARLERYEALLAEFGYGAALA